MICIIYWLCFVFVEDNNSCRSILALSSVFNMHFVLFTIWLSIKCIDIIDFLKRFSASYYTPLQEYSLQFQTQFKHFLTTCKHAIKPLLSHNFLSKFNCIYTDCIILNFLDDLTVTRSLLYLFNSFL